MVFRVQPDRDWEDLDFKLLEAYQAMEDESCPKCGQPVWLCRSTDDRITWAVDNTTCYSTRALEEKQESRKKKGDKKATADEKKSWGRIEYAVPRVPGHLPEGTELPTRKDYYESLTVE